MLSLSNTTNIEGNTIRWGSYGNGPPLVAIHGTPFSSQVWRRIIPLLGEYRTIYYFDLAGYGLSEKYEGQDVSLGIQNKILVALFKEWNIERPDILAHDFGGATALRAYFLDGLRYASLTIFDAVALAPWGSQFVQHVRKHESVFAEMPAYMHQALLKAYLSTSAYTALSEEAIEIYSKPWIEENGQAAFYRQISQMQEKYTNEIEALYEKMDCPVTVLWGIEDKWIPYEMGIRLAKLISDQECILIPGSGHLMQEDRPEAIIAATLKTIKI